MLILHIYGVIWIFSRTHDKAHERWMPHINLLFPFITDYETQLPDAAHKIQTGMVPICPFKVTFNKDSFGYFSHKKKAVLWLKPFWKQCTSENQTDVNDTAGAGAANNAASYSHNPSVLGIQKQLEILFPEFNELSSRTDNGFQPHLTLGQFRPKDVERVKVQYQKDWNDFDFEVKEVYIISRSDLYDPFHVRFAVPLGCAPDWVDNKTFDYNIAHIWVGLCAQISTLRLLLWRFTI